MIHKTIALKQNLCYNKITKKRGDMHIMTKIDNKCKTREQLSAQLATLTPQELTAVLQLILDIISDAR